MYHHKCIYCGMVGRPLLFHDVRVSVDNFFLCSVTPNCRSSDLRDYFDFNNQYIMDRQVAWISQKLKKKIKQSTQLLTSFWLK